MSRHFTKRGARGKISDLELSDAKLAQQPGHSSGHRFKRYRLVEGLFHWKVVEVE